MIYNSSKTGSITVEAALVLPIFVTFVIILTFFMQLIYVHEIVQKGLDEVTQIIAVQANIYDTLGTKESIQTSYERLSSDDENEIIDDIKSVLVEQVINRLGAALLKTYFINKTENNNFGINIIVDGLDGLDFTESKFLIRNDDVKSVVMYKAKPIFNLFGVFELNVIQVATSKAWTGYNQEMPKEDVVYKTKSGTVYHVIRTCSYIHFTIIKTTFKEIEGQGPCVGCAIDIEFQENDRVYITKTGDKYHRTLDCSKIKRVIIEINRSDIGNLQPCSRCGGLEEN